MAASLRGVASDVGPDPGSPNTNPLQIPTDAVEGDRLFLHVTFTSGLQLPIPTGWAATGPGVINALQVSSRIFTRLVAAGEPGTSVSYSHVEAGRWSMALYTIADPGVYDVIEPTTTTNSTAIVLPAITPTADNALLLASVGERLGAALTSPSVAPPAGWTERADLVSNNSTGQRVGIWGATKALGASTSGVAQGPWTATADETTRQCTWVISIVPAVIGAPVVNAGADRSTFAGANIPLVGTFTGGSGTVESRTWTQRSGPSVTLVNALTANASYLAPNDTTATVRVFRYTVIDGLGNVGYDEVTHTNIPAPYRAVIGGVEVPMILSVPKLDVVPVSSKLFESAFAGGGGQSASDVSGFDRDVIAVGTDTGGIRISHDGMNTSVVHTLGFNGARSKQTDGVRWSRLVPGRLFMTCGDGTAGNGGVYVSEDANTRHPTPWRRLDGVAGPNLIFDGGNSNVAGAPIGPYPRHYGRVIEIDEITLADHTFVHLATVTDGVWRIKVRNSDLVAVEQVRFAGTAGAYIRCLRMATYGPNSSGDTFSRLLISQYNEAAPLPVLVCSNANDTTTNPTLATAAIASLTNIHAIGYIKTATGQPVTIFAKQGSVMLSTNAMSAAAGSITATEVAATSGAPETSQAWIGVGTTNNGSTYVLIVGCFGGVGSGGNFNVAWRGTWNESSTTPWSAVAWTVLDSAHWNEQLMGLAGVANRWWLNGSNTPGHAGTAAISAFSTSSSDPSRLYAAARGNSYASDDYGQNWYATRVFGSANHSYVAWDWYIHPNTFATTTGDWPIASTTDGFDTNPTAVMKFAGANALAVWFDPKTGDVFIGGAVIPGHAVPATDNNNTVWRLPWSSLATEYGSLASMPIADLNLNTGSGPSTAVAGVMAGATAYGSAGAGTVRCIVVGTLAGQGMWHTKNEGITWTRVLATDGTLHPFSTTSSHSASQAFLDVARNKIYFMERATGSVWRLGVNADGSLSEVVRIWANPWAYSSTNNGSGYIDIDTVNNRLWISTVEGVWFISSVSTVPPATDESNSVVSGFVANYPGELAGPMVYMPGSGRVLVATQHLSASGVQLYPMNNSLGPRLLEISSPTSPGSWSPANAVDWTQTKDSAYQRGFIAPHGIARNVDGTKICLTMQGSGVGWWNAQGGGADPPVADPWDTLDSSVPTASTGLFAMYGVLFGDPQGNTNVTDTGVDKTVSETIRFSRNKPATGINKSVKRFGDAAVAIGGTATYDVTGVAPDDKDRVTVTGVAVNLRYDTKPSILTGATGIQVRTFVAALVEGEGNVNGLVMDDPSLAHVTVVADLIASNEGYNIPSTISATSFKTLTITSDYFPRIQAYPFVVYGRCPGGAPA